MANDNHGGKHSTDKFKQGPILGSAAAWECAADHLDEIKNRVGGDPLRNWGATTAIIRGVVSRYLGAKGVRSYLDDLDDD